MTQKEKIEFRQMMVSFLLLVEKYPNDADRIEAGMQLFEKFINRLLDERFLQMAGPNARMLKAN